MINTQYYKKMSGEKACLYGLESPNIKAQLINEVAKKCLEKFMSKAEDLFIKLSEPINYKLKDLENKCEENQILLSSIKIQIQCHQGMFDNISKFCENKHKLLYESIESQALKFDKQRKKDVQELMNQIEKLMKIQSKYTKKIQMFQKQKLRQAQLKDNIIAINKNFQEFQQRNQQFLSEYLKRDIQISSLNQQFKALKTKIFAEGVNRQQQNPLQGNMLLTEIVKQLRKSQSIKGKCFHFQLGQNKRNPSNKIKGFTLNNRFIIQKIVQDKKQYQFVNSIGVSNEECVTYPFRIGKIKESAFIGFITENTIGNLQFDHLKVAYYCNHGAFWIWGKQVESKVQTNQAQQKILFEATIDLARKRVYWKMKNEILADAEIPKNMWNQTFYFAVIIGDLKDKIYIDLS